MTAGDARNLKLWNMINQLLFFARNRLSKDTAFKSEKTGFNYKLVGSKSEYLSAQESIWCYDETHCIIDIKTW